MAAVANFTRMNAPHPASAESCIAEDTAAQGDSRVGSELASQVASPLRPRPDADASPSRRPEAKPRITVVLHDAAPATWDACQRVLDALAEVAPVPVTFLAVPRYHFENYDRSFEQRLDDRLARGDELALHGYTHWDDGEPRSWVDHMRRRWYTASEGEFCALNRRDAEVRLQAGARWFERNGWPLHGFVAPAWLMSAGTWDALGGMSFDYTCTLREVFDLRRGDAVHSHSLVYSTRSAWRRALSKPVNEVVARRIASQPLVRLELHPWDADYREVRESWQGLLAGFLQDREAVTMVKAVSG
ncbi:DUF2334 domain-containing protein [soil metagenome]